jgi:hypothetical protein
MAAAFSDRNARVELSHMAQAWGRPASHAHGGGIGLEEAADDSAVCKHVEIVIAAMAGTSGLPTRVSRYAPQSFRCASKK